MEHKNLNLIAKVSQLKCKTKYLQTKRIKSNSLNYLANFLQIQNKNFKKLNKIRLDFQPL